MCEGNLWRMERFHISGKDFKMDRQAEIGNCRYDSLLQHLKKNIVTELQYDAMKTVNCNR